MNVKLAKTAGFCFGVDRGVNIVYELVNNGVNVATLGPIIHNPQLVCDLNKKGAVIVDNLDNSIQDKTLVIRSHGVSKKIYDEINCLNLDYVDATCPFVSKIHKIVSEQSNKGKIVFIAGDKQHPEVVGIVGHCNNKGYIFKNKDELKNLLKNFQCEKIVIVSQTTFNTNIWEECVCEIEKYENIEIFPTICNATNVRQKEAIDLAKNSDLMIVIGGKHSSNTNKLSQVCEKYCETLLIETKDELDLKAISKYNNISITAGASTPAYIIQEVLDKMNVENNELSFEEMLESSLNEKLFRGKRIKGVVTSIAPNEIQVDVGAKQSGFVPLSELTDEPNKKPDEIVKKGEEIDLIVLKVNDQEGTITLSKKRCDAEVGFEKIQNAFEKGEILKGIVTNVVKGGVLVLTYGVKVFIPASLVSDMRIENLDILLKKEVEYKIIEVKQEKKRAVGSIKEVLVEYKKVLAEQIWTKLEKGQEYKGIVKSLTGFGTFVDIGGVDGLVHITELAWVKIKHPSEITKVGEELEVYIKDIDKEKRKLSLGHKKSEDNPWEIFAKKYSEGDEVEAKIVSITPFGAFAEIIPGVEGLIHISEISHDKVSKVNDVLEIGQKVKVKILEAAIGSRRLGLSIKALIDNKNKKEQDEDLQAAINAGIIEFTSND